MSCVNYIIKKICLDVIIKVTMNKVSKLKSSWLSIFKNEKQLPAHSRNCNNIVYICNAVHRRIGIKKIVYKHTVSYQKSCIQTYCIIPT